MADTIPSGRPLAPLTEARVFQEIAHIDAHRRINLLPRWTARFDWMRPTASKGAELLMVMREPGFVRLLPWIPQGVRVADRFAEVSVLESSSENLEEMRLLQDSFGRLVLDVEHRPYLGDAALAHLGVPLGRGERSPVYVVIYPESVGIMSIAERQRRAGTARTLDDLPM